MKAGPLAECSYERGKSREQELATKLKELEARLDVVSHGSKGSEPAQEKSFESRISVPEIPSTDVLLAAASGLGSGISEPVKELTADWFKDDVIPIPVRDYLYVLFSFRESFHGLN
jgi:phage repressor protein C with HTH and peptisase S24 domain